MAAGLIAVVLLSGASIFYCLGGRWFTVLTPSMGTTAPVGSLLLTVSTPFQQLHVGEIVTFHTPTTPSETYSHRITDIDSTAGTGSTRGDINGAEDPWPLTPQMVVGRVIVIAPGIGWLLRLVPLTVAGVLLVTMLTTFVRAPLHRSNLRSFGTSAVVSALLTYFKPLTGIDTVSSAPAGRGALVTIVSTGLLPIRVGVPNHSTHLTTGEVAHLRLHALRSSDHFTLPVHLDLDPAQTAALISFCLLPVLGSALITLRRTRGTR